MTYQGGQKSYKDVPQWYDPLGPTSISYDKNGKPSERYSTTGAVPLRENIFSQVKANQPTVDASTGKLVSSLNTAAEDPGWAAAQDNARKTISGDYLSGSPQLDAAMAATRRSQMNAAADSSARNQANFARGGMSFSTGAQQADQSNRAAAAAAAGGTEAQARLANYEAERQNQIKGADQLQAAQAAPMNYLQNVTSALYNPLATEASLISGLSTGGPVAAPNSTIVKQPGAADYLQGVASAY